MEVAVGVGVGVVERRRVLAPQPAAEPAALDLGEVAHDAEQRRVAADETGAGLLVGEPVDLQ